MNNNEILMGRAIRLARKGKGKVSPNPLVGAVIVNRGTIVGTGYHKKAGEEHAEVAAIRKAGKKAKGSTMYVNLEPCCHYGKTPPCTEAIRKAGIKKVFIGTEDPNPLVSGKGIKQLTESGIKVMCSLLEKDARKLNEYYLTFMEKQRPFVILKIAQTLDGKIADSTGNSKWITNENARRKVHSLRNEVDAILTGIGTVIKDNPELTSRLPGNKKEPIRIVLDSHLKTPRNAKIARAGTIIATSLKSNSLKKNILIKKGVEIWQIPGKKDGISLDKVLKKSRKEDIQSILVEAGAKVTSSFLREHLVDKLYIFISNKILGTGLPAIYNIGANKLQKAILLEDSVFQKLNDNILLTGYVHWNN